MSRSLGAMLGSLWMIIVICYSRPPCAVQMAGRVFRVVLEGNLLVSCIRRCQCG